MKIIKFDKDRDKYGFDWLVKELERVQNDRGIEIMVTVYKEKDGTIGIGATEANQAEIIGMLELGKTSIIDDLHADDFE